MKTHELTKLAAALCFATLCLVSTAATAQNLGTCDPQTETCDCTSTWAQNHDACQIQPLYKVNDPITDYGTIANWANISAGWESGDLYVTADFDDYHVMVIDVPSNGGIWEDVTELNDYLSDLLGTTVDVSTSGGSFDIYYEQTGTFARWDSANEEWASNQAGGNLIWAAITGADGTFQIDDYDITLGFDVECTTATNNNFSGEQCTTIVSLASYTCTAGGGCSGCTPPDCITNLVPDVHSNIFNFENGSYGLYYDAFPDATWTWGFRRVRVLADEADMQNLYYSLGGNPSFISPDYPSIDYDTDGSSSAATNQYGACGFGEAQRLEKGLEPVTFNGTAPTSVAACQEDLAGL